MPEEDFVRGVTSELALRVEEEGLGGEGLSVGSVYFGGGTPSLLSPGAVGEVLKAVSKELGLEPGAEVTLEANPESARSGKLLGFFSAGVTRLSVGVQSLVDTDLRALGRLHSAEDALDTLRAVRRAGFANLGADLIFGVPGSTVDGFLSSVEKTAPLVEHISIYGLTIEEGTPFAGLYAPGGSLAGELPEEDTFVEMYTRGVDTLKGAGFTHYEISNLARPGFESVHNRGYWSGRPYLGLGPGSHSYTPWPAFGRRSWNVPSLEDYLEGLGDGRRPLAGEEELSRDQAMEEEVLLGLRMLETGVDPGAFAGRFGPDQARSLTARLQALVDKGLVEKTRRGYVLTPKGVLFSNEAAIEAA